MNRLTIVGATEGEYGNARGRPVAQIIVTSLATAAALLPPAAAVLCNDRKGIFPSGRFSRVSQRTPLGRSCGSESHGCLKRLHSSLRWLPHSLCW
jgi:hypothetical protein